MPFEIPLGETSPALASGVSALMGIHQQRQNDAMQAQLAELNLKSMMMQQNAREASQNYALAQERLASETSYRNARLQDADLNRDATNSRYYAGLQERQAGRAQRGEEFGERMDLAGERLEDLEGQRDTANQMARERLNLSQSIEARKRAYYGSKEGGGNIKTLNSSYRILKDQNAQDIAQIRALSNSLTPDQKQISALQDNISQRKQQIMDISNQILRGGQASTAETSGSPDETGDEGDASQEAIAMVDENNPLGAPQEMDIPNVGKIRIIR